MDAELQVDSAAKSGPSELFEQLAALVYAEADFTEVYSAICVSAPRLVDGCDHASLIMRQHGRFVTVAASDDVAGRVDDLERANQAGPCLDAVTDETPQLEPDLMSLSQWPLFAKQVVATTPVRGAAGFRIVVRQNKSGALNLFSDSAGALTAASVNQGIILTSFASVALAAVDRQESADTLAEGLLSNREIGKAIGLMMAFHKVSDDAAFEILRQASQDMNLKLSEVALRVVSHHSSGRD